MEKNRLKLPAGIHTFEKIRNGNFIYVDKTKYLVDLIDTGDVYFLSRPRRFGKSLTVSTFKELFSGNRELFKGLYAEEFLNRPDFKPSPVIRLDMSKVNTGEGIEVFKESLQLVTLEIADLLEVEVPKQANSVDIFRNIIINSYKKYSSKVVVLVDEYDKPFTDFFDNPTMAEQIRSFLRTYYSQIKSNEEYIRFIFITGITKFTKMGVFSTLNNLTDISPLEKYGEMLGYTDAEIINYFPEYIDETAKKYNISNEELIVRMRNYYDGFSFDSSGKHHLYNPYSTLRFFFSQDFVNYWFESGTPSVLAKYFKDNNLTVEQFRNYPVSKDDIYNSVEIENASPVDFLFQCGYLSLRSGTNNKLLLDYPNTEVLDSMSKLFTKNILQNNSENFNFCRNNLHNALEEVDYNAVIEVFNCLLASIPYDDYSKAAEQSIKNNKYNIKPQEWLYRSNLFSFLRGCDVLVFAEMHTNLGRADLVVSYEGKTWIIELKVAYKGQNPKKKAQEAFKQIIDNNYAKPYPNAVCIGMAIDDEVRQITEYRINNEQ